MSYMDEADEPHFDRPEILIAISDAATGKILQTISLPARRIDHPFTDARPEQPHALRCERASR